MPKSKPPRKKSSPGVYSKPSKNSIMKDLNRLDAECERMLEATAQFAPYLTNRELVAAGDYEKINDNASILARDTVQLKGQLDAIRADKPKRLNPEYPNDVMAGLSIGERYSEWQDNYERAVLPTVERLSALLKDASDQLGKAKTQVTETEKDSEHE